MGHKTLKQEVNQAPYEFPGQLERAIADFVEYYNFRRYHKALGNVTPADVLYGRREEILERRKEVQIQQLIVAETTTRASGSLLMPPDYAKVFGLKSVPFR